MEGNAQSFYWFSNEKVNIEVPYFQRPYVWEEDDWKELINSINNSDKKMPFIGSFILQKNNPEESNFLIIDGQQRITTISILIKAFIDAYDNLPPNVYTKLLDMIYVETMVDLESSYKPRLKSSFVDAEHYEKIMERKLDINKIDTNNNIETCYKYFFDYFKSIDNKELNIFGTKLISSDKFYINIVLDKSDDEQRIFDSVNSLGKELTNSDIIKNYIFQTFKNKSENNRIHLQNIIPFHQKYWVNVFYNEKTKDFWKQDRTLGRIKVNMIEAFLKDFGVIKEIYNPNDTGGIEGLSKAYKKYINDIVDYEGIKNLIIEIAEYAEIFYSYNNDYQSNGDFKLNDVLNTTLLILDKTETSTFNPYILKLVKENPDNRDQLLLSLQKFLLQRLIYKASTKNYNKICSTLLKSDDPINYLKQYNDNEVIDYRNYPEGLLKINNKPATLILFIIELIRRNKDLNKYSDAFNYVFSLEHVLPKNHSKWDNVPAYKFDIIGKKFIEISDTNEKEIERKGRVNNIGNMTLLTGSLNSSIGNDSFAIKIDGDALGTKKGIRGFVGNLSISSEIVSFYDSPYENQKNGIWDERQILKRNKQLFDDLNSFYRFI